MELLKIIAGGVVALFILWAVLDLPFELKQIAELKRKKRDELEQLVFRYEENYFSFIGHDHQDVVTFKKLLEDKNISEIKKRWKALSRSFRSLERKAGHAGRPLILDYYCWYELEVKELAKRGI